MSKWKARRRVRRRLRSYKRRGGGISRLHASMALPIIKLTACVLLAGGVVAAIIIWGVPFVGGVLDPKPSQTVVPNEFVTPNAGDVVEQSLYNDLSSLQTEALIEDTTINDPYLHGGDIVYSTATTENGVTRYNKLMIYDCASGSSSEVAGVELKYENIINCILNDGYIVYTDANSAGGGRLLGYDRAAKKQFVIKEYAFAVPHISISGNMIAFMQQAGDSLYKLYIYDLTSRESVCAKTYSGVKYSPTPAFLSGQRLIWATSKDGGDNAPTSVLYTQMLSDASASETFSGKYIADPQTDGTHIVFTSQDKGPRCDLFMIAGSSTTMIADDVLNYMMGEGFVAFTKDDSILIYDFSTEKTSIINTGVSKALLASVDGSQVCWYDVTGGYGGIDIVKYADVANRASVSGTKG